MTAVKSPSRTFTEVKPEIVQHIFSYWFPLWPHWCGHKGNGTAAMTQAVWHCRQIGLQVDYQTSWSRSKSNMLFVTPMVCTDLHCVCGETQAKVLARHHFVILSLPVSATTTEHKTYKNTADVPVHWRLTGAAVFSESRYVVGTLVKGKLTRKKMFFVKSPYATRNTGFWTSGVLAPEAVGRGGRGSVDRRWWGRSCSSELSGFGDRLNNSAPPPPPLLSLRVRGRKEEMYW